LFEIVSFIKNDDFYQFKLHSFYLNFASCLQEKVEEDRFIKDQEAIIAEKYHELKAAEMTENMVKNMSMQNEHLKMQRAALIKAAFEDISSTLLKTGDKISKEGAKNIAHWKLGFKE